MVSGCCPRTSVPTGGSSSPNRDPNGVRCTNACRRACRRDLREMRAAGVRILAGTDIGVLNVVPGQSLHEELALLVRDANLSPLDALRAATRDAAVFLGLEQEIGTIAAGKKADLILLDADPLADVAHVSRI